MVCRSASTGSGDWCKFIAGGASADIDIDNEGVMPDTRILVDLSQALSQRFGKQMSMMSTYRVNYVRVELLNVDDIVMDNSSAASFSGKCQFWSPSKHRIDAMKTARALEKSLESIEVDNDSWLLSTDTDYSGMRFNWDADDQVVYATIEGFTGLAGAQWDLGELFSVYGGMLGTGGQTNSMWAANYRCGYQEQFGFSMDYSNYGVDDSPIPDSTRYLPRSTPYENHFPNALEVLGGLMMFDITHSSTDAPEVIDDDYQVQITIGIEGWSDF